VWFPVVVLILSFAALVKLSVGAVRAYRSPDYRREAEQLREQKIRREAARRKPC